MLRQKCLKILLRLFLNLLNVGGSVYVSIVSSEKLDSQIVVPLICRSLMHVYSMNEERVYFDDFRAYESVS